MGSSDFKSILQGSERPGRFRPCIRGVHPFRERTISNIFRHRKSTSIHMNQTITQAETTLKTVPRMITRIFEIVARADRVGVAVTRIGLIVVLLWIGGLKAFKYEAQGIVPFVANSPLMSFFYADPGHYKAHMNPDGTLDPANGGWHEQNTTYP